MICDMHAQPRPFGDRLHRETIHTGAGHAGGLGAPHQADSNLSTHQAESNLTTHQQGIFKSRSLGQCLLAIQAASPQRPTIKRFGALGVYMSLALRCMSEPDDNALRLAAAPPPKPFFFSAPSHHHVASACFHVPLKSPASMLFYLSNNG